MKLKLTKWNAYTLLVSFAILGCVESKPPTEDLDLKGENLRAAVTRDMKIAADSIGVELLDVEISISTRGDLLAAHALINEPDVQLEKQKNVSLLYLSLPNFSICNNQIGKGFYLLKRDSELDREPIGTDTLTTKGLITDLTGKVVANVPIHQVKIEAPEEETDSEQSQTVAFSELAIEQNMSNMVLYCIKAHGTICYPGVWYWTWVYLCTGSC